MQRQSQQSQLSRSYAPKDFRIIARKGKPYKSSMKYEVNKYYAVQELYQVQMKILFSPYDWYKFQNSAVYQALKEYLELHESGNNKIQKNKAIK